MDGSKSQVTSIDGRNSDGDSPGDRHDGLVTNLALRVVCHMWRPAGRERERSHYPRHPMQSTLRNGVDSMGLARYKLTQLIIRLGPNSPVVRAILRLRCRGASLKFHDGKVDVSVGNRIIRIADKHFPYAADMAANFETYFSQVNPEQQGANKSSITQRRGFNTTRMDWHLRLHRCLKRLRRLKAIFAGIGPKLATQCSTWERIAGSRRISFPSVWVPLAKFFAFEPDSTSYSLLQKNIARHRLDNVVTLPFAIAGQTSTAEFSSEGTMGSTLTRHSSRATLGSVETVKTISLADACARYGIPAFAKVDIEGSEIGNAFG